MVTGQGGCRRLGVQPALQGPHVQPQGIPLMLDSLQLGDLLLRMGMQHSHLQQCRGCSELKGDCRSYSVQATHLKRLRLNGLSRGVELLSLGLPIIPGQCSAYLLCSWTDKKLHENCRTCS